MQQTPRTRPRGIPSPSNGAARLRLCGLIAAQKLLILLFDPKTKSVGINNVRVLHEEVNDETGNKELNGLCDLGLREGEQTFGRLFLEAFQ